MNILFSKFFFKIATDPGVLQHCCTSHALPLWTVTTQVESFWLKKSLFSTYCSYFS